MNEREQLRYDIIIGGLPIVQRKVFDILCEKECTQTMLVNRITDQARPSIYSSIRALERKKLIKVCRIDGRNKFFTANVEIVKDLREE
ncbi:MAG: hypothetical protein RR009_06850 [Oscillospiraceae bacterium]